jgi:hypothetical protein
MDIFLTIIGLILAYMALENKKIRQVTKLVMCAFSSMYIIVLTNPNIYIWSVKEYTNENVIMFFNTQLFRYSILWIIASWLFFYCGMKYLIIGLFDSRLMKYYKNKIENFDIIKNNKFYFFIYGFISGVNAENNNKYKIENNDNDKIKETEYTKTKILQEINSSMYPTLLSIIHLFSLFVFNHFFHLIKPFDFLPFYLICIIFIIYLILDITIIPLIKILSTYQHNGNAEKSNNVNFEHFKKIVDFLPESEQKLYKSFASFDDFVKYKTKQILDMIPESDREFYEKYDSFDNFIRDKQKTEANINAILTEFTEKYKSAFWFDGFDGKRKSIEENGTTIYSGDNGIFKENAMPLKLSMVVRFSSFKGTLYRNPNEMFEKINS